jgi:hypothetical protein
MGFRVVVVSDGATTTTQDETPLAEATVVIDDQSPPAKTGADGTVTFANTPGKHTISVFLAGYSYVTVVNTAATDVLIPLKPTPRPGEFRGQLKETDFNNVSNPNGTLHLDVTGASIGGNLIDTSLSQLFGPTQPVTILLGTQMPYGPYNLPEGFAIGLGAQMFGEDGGGHYGAVAAPGLRALWSFGGNAVIGDVLKVIGPSLNDPNAGVDQLPTLVTALLPIVGSLESAVTAGVVVQPGDQKALSSGGAQPSLKLDSLQRIHLQVSTPRLPSYVNDTGGTTFYDAEAIVGGVFAGSQGFVPLGVTAGVDRGGPVATNLPDHITDALGTNGQAGKLPLRVAPRHGGVEDAPWAFVTLGASLADFAHAIGSDAREGLVLSGNVSRFQKGTNTPYTLTYNGGANTSVDLSDAFLPPPGVAHITDRTLTSTDVPGASLLRIDVGSDSDRWLIYFPPGTTRVEVPAVPESFDDRWVGTTSPPGVTLEAVSLGYQPGLTYDGVWKFDGTAAADLSMETDRFSVRRVKR